MSEIRVNNIIDEAGTGAPTFPNGATGNLTGNVTGNVTGTATTATALSGTPNITVGTVTGTNATFSGNLTVQGTTTTIDTAVTAVDSIAVDGAGTFGGTVRVNHTGNAGSDQLVRLGNVNNSVTNSAHLFLANGYYVSPTAVDGTGAAAKILADGTIHDSIGPLRNIPMNDQSSNASYTLIISDAGKLVHASGTTSTVVVPNGVFGAGNAVTILNGDGSNTLTISQGSGFSLRNTADSSTGNRTLAVFGMATIYFTGSGVGYISGAGLS